MLKRRRMLMGIEDFANGHEYVDLGLPSGTMWSTEVLYGYCWGETTSRQAYGTQVNDHVYGGDNGTKYNSTDNLTELEPSDDAAIVNFGGAWVTPSIEQFQELLDYTTAVPNLQLGYVDLTSTINGATLRVTYGPVYDFWTRNSHILNPAPNVEVTLANYVDILGRNIDYKSRDYVLNVLPCIINPGFKELTFSNNGNTVDYGSGSVYYYPKIDGDYIYGTVNDITIYNDPDNYVGVYSSSSSGMLYLWVYRPINTGNTEITRSYIIDYKGKARAILTYHQGFLEYSQVDTTCRLLMHFENDYVNSVSGKELSHSTSGLTLGSSYRKVGNYGVRFEGGTDTSASSIWKDSFITITNNTKFTIDFWIFPLYNNTNHNGIFSLWTSSAPGSPCFSVYTKYSNSSSVVLEFNNNDTGETPTTVCSLQNTTYQHIAITYDATKSSNRLIFYRNGTQVYSSNKLFSALTYNLRLGKSEYVTRGARCYLDELHMSDRVLWTSNFTPPVTPWSTS